MSVFFFFFKQKTAYEMRISDWSSDVCSSDLLARAVEHVIDLVMGDPMRADRRAGVEHALAELHRPAFDAVRNAIRGAHPDRAVRRRSEEHTSELQSLMRISYAVFCLKKKKNK